MRNEDYYKQPFRVTDFMRGVYIYLFGAYRDGADTFIWTREGLSWAYQSKILGKVSFGFLTDETERLDIIEIHGQRLALILESDPVVAQNVRVIEKTAEKIHLGFLAMDSFWLYLRNKDYLKQPFEVTEFMQKTYDILFEAYRSGADTFYWTEQGLAWTLEGIPMNEYTFDDIMDKKERHLLIKQYHQTLIFILGHDTVVTQNIRIVDQTPEKLHLAFIYEGLDA